VADGKWWNTAGLLRILRDLPGAERSPIAMQLLTLLDELRRSDFKCMTPQQFDEKMENVERENGRTIGEEIDQAVKIIKEFLNKNVPLSEESAEEIITSLGLMGRDP
jgi:hypothetical protein